MINRLVILASALAVVALSAPIGNASHAATLFGEAQAMGKGSVRSYAIVRDDGKPTAVGIAFKAAALDDLPAEPNRTSRCFDLDGNGRINDHGECEGDYELRLALPGAVTDRGDVPFRWVGVNWNPHGHPPGPWLLPHFDFHFYMVEPAAIDAIRVGPCDFFIDCEDRQRALKPVAVKFVHSDHVNVDAAVSMMGNHLIDSTTPELAKENPKTFTHTLIFGAYDGHITFYEPMITLAYILSHENGCHEIKQPAAWEQAGYYPRLYCIRYSDEHKSYTVSLEGIRFRQAE